MPKQKGDARHAALAGPPPRAFPGKVDLKGVHARLRGLWVFRKEMRKTSNRERFPIGKRLKHSDALRRIDRRNIDQPQLHALVAVPAVEAQGAGGVDRAAAAAQQGLAERLAGG